MDTYPEFTTDHTSIFNPAPTKFPTQVVESKFTSFGDGDYSTFTFYRQPGQKIEPLYKNPEDYYDFDGNPTWAKHRYEMEIEKRQKKSLSKPDDSSRARGTSLRNHSLAGQVVTRWDTFNTGQNPIFLIPPKLVRGPPPQFDDICKDGGLLMEILDRGSSKWKNTKDPDDFIVKYEARLDDGTLVAKSHLVEFTFKDGHYCLALSKTVKTMKKGEKVILTVKPQYGLGEKGKPALGRRHKALVPPNATLYYEVQQVKFVGDKGAWDMNTNEKILAARKKREEGEAMVRAKKFARASKKFEKAVKFLEYDTSFCDNEKKYVMSLKLHLYTSNIMCKMFLNDFDQVTKLRAKAMEFQEKEEIMRLQYLLNVV